MPLHHVINFNRIISFNNYPDWFISIKNQITLISESIKIIRNKFIYIIKDNNKNNSNNKNNNIKKNKISDN